MAPSFSGSGAVPAAPKNGGGGAPQRGCRRGVRATDRRILRPHRQGGRGRTHGPAHVRRHSARATGQRGRERRVVRGLRPVPASDGVRDGSVQRRRQRHHRGGRGAEVGPGRHGRGGQPGVAVFRVRAVPHRTDQGPAAGGRPGAIEHSEGQRRGRGQTPARGRHAAGGGPRVEDRGRAAGHVPRTRVDGGPRDARLLRVLLGVRGEPHVPERLAPRARRGHGPGDAPRRTGLGDDDGGRGGRHLPLAGRVPRGRGQVPHPSHQWRRRLRRDVQWQLPENNGAVRAHRWPVGPVPRTSAHPAAHCARVRGHVLDRGAHRFAAHRLRPVIGSFRWDLAAALVNP